jgi:hypothetical protein
LIPRPITRVLVCSINVSISSQAQCSCLHFVFSAAACRLGTCRLIRDMYVCDQITISLFLQCVRPGVCDFGSIFLYAAMTAMPKSRFYTLRHVVNFITHVNANLRQYWSDQINLTNYSFDQIRIYNFFYKECNWSYFLEQPR